MSNNTRKARMMDIFEIIFIILLIVALVLGQISYVVIDYFEEKNGVIYIIGVLSFILIFACVVAALYYLFLVKL